MIGEIFPLSVRGVSASCGSAAKWLGNFIVSRFFLVLLTMFRNNIGGPFAVFAVLSIPFVARCVPENKGAFPEEIERDLVGR